MAFKYRYRPKGWDTRLILGVAAIVLVSIFILYFSPVYQPGQTPTTTTTTIPATTTTTIQPPKIEVGKLIVTVKDEQHKLPGGTTVLNISMKIGNITAHYVLGNESKWVVVSSGFRTIQLLDYTDITAIIGQSDLEAGKYTQIRIYVAEANITIRNAFFNIYTSKTYPMVVPSHELKAVHEFSVDANKTTALTVDFDVENSVVHTADGYILKPVVKISNQTIAYGELPKNSKVIV